MIRKIPALRNQLKQIYKFHRVYCTKNDTKSKCIELPPEPTTCCTSGCVDCVWIKYANEVTQRLQGQEEEVIERILDKITDPNLKMFLKLELRVILLG